MPEPDFAAAALGTFLDAAFGRIAAARHAAAAGNAEELLLELHSLKGLCAQAGARGPAEVAHDLEERVLTEGVATPALASGLDGVEATLATMPGAATAPRTVPVAAVVERIAGEMRAVARRRGVDVQVAATAPAQQSLPRRTAGLLFDVLGHLARNAVVHGAGGGRVRVALTVVLDADGITCTLDDDGAVNRADVPVDVDAGRGLGLAAASARVTQAGGRIEYGARSPGFRATVWLPPDWCHAAGRG